MNQQLAAAKLVGDQPAAASPQALADRKELAFIAVERTRMPMVVVDPRQNDMPIVLANQSFLDLTGYTADEVIGRNCRLLQGPETDAASVSAIKAALEARREITIELVNYRRDGKQFWNQLFISPVEDADGTLLYFFASQLDVTERRRARELERAEHMLLREVDHRAKNALALVQGIVRLSRQQEPEQYANAVQGRVDSLARAHALLSDSHWQTVDLLCLIRGEAEQYGYNRIEAHGPVIALPAKQVQPIGLLLHEMLENASTHGALSKSDGTVSVSWSITDANTFVLGWVETGGPPPSAERVAGFGSRMIKGIVDSQLRGSLDYDWVSTGLRCSLTIPLISVPVH